MKNLKKQLCIIAAICCCAGFTACSDSAGNSSTDDSSSEVKSDEIVEKDSDDDSTDDNDADDSDTNRNNDNVDDEEENESSKYEKEDEEEDTDEQEEKTTEKKTESSFSPQFADEDDVEVKEWSDPDDKTNVGYLITWKDSPCIGKSVTVDGIEICGGETLGDCDFDNWSMSYDYDSGDKCRLPRKTQKIDKQNTKKFTLSKKKSLLTANQEAEIM